MKKQLLALTLVAGFTGCSLFAPQVPEKNEVKEVIEAKEVIEPKKPIEKTEAPEASDYTTYALSAEEQKVAGNSVPEPELLGSGSIAAETLSEAPEKHKMMGPATVGAGSMAQAQGMAYPSSYIATYDGRSESANTESYDGIVENSFHQCLAQPTSTFSIDVDTAAYSNMRRMITQGVFPNKDAIRIEELINYFNYDYAAPETGAFAVAMETAPALWNKKHRVVRIGVKGKEMKVDKRPASNLVFLVDVSGSMDQPEKLPLVKSALGMLVENLGSNDKISIIVYAGAAGMVLSPTTGNHKKEILASLENLKAGGSTNGGGGIELAYKTAKENFIKGGVNRVILATDGDFNVGTTSREALVELVEKNAKGNVYLSILGFGMGNYKDGLMETLSNKGNGNYAYIDNRKEAKKVMVDQLSGTLVTIAKDVKIQVEFNPKFVAAYRLVGYENRVLKNEDFDNDKKDAGDIGAGHTVTALYEIVPVGVEMPAEKEESLKYKKTEEKKVEVAAVKAVSAENNSNELLTLKIRYKKPDGDVSAKQEFILKQQETAFDNATESFRFSSAVALFGMLLRGSENVKDGNYDTVIEIAGKAKGSDKHELRSEFIELVRKVDAMKSPRQAKLAD